MVVVLLELELVLHAASATAITKHGTRHLQFAFHVSSSLWCV